MCVLCLFDARKCVRNDADYGYGSVFAFAVARENRVRDKKTNFSIFKKIVHLMAREKAHLTREGKRRILELREELNKGKGRKRKYNLSDCLTAEESSETTRRMPADLLGAD